MGQLFDSRLGGQLFASWGCTHNGTGFLLLVLSCYIGDPDMLGHWPRPRLRVDNRKLHEASRRNVKSQLWSHMPSPVPFHSLQVLLLLATQWPFKAPLELLGGGKPCGGPAISLQYTVGQLFASRLQGQWFPAWGCTHNWTGFLLLALSHYIPIIWSLGWQVTCALIFSFQFRVWHWAEAAIFRVWPCTGVAS